MSTRPTLLNGKPLEPAGAPASSSPGKPAKLSRGKPTTTPSARTLSGPSRGTEIARWIAFGGIGLVLVVLTALVMTRQDAEEFVEDTYPLHVMFEDRGLDGHVAAGRVSDVVREISDGVGSPLDLQYADDGAAFMKYEDHIVAIFPEHLRTRVHADDYRTVWNAYSEYTGQWWSSSPPSSSSGYRGGGFGWGK
ncbi:DUF4247 domain-containing protein [Myceligenerans crystallogenes]|uniref:DUF4247 domain-containing protein n=1 Tax=Myceligenerans crystallogenes TaxID=316335 RepID=A0ABP4ZXM1_9MICO